MFTFLEYLLIQSLEFVICLPGIHHNRGCTAEHDLKVLYVIAFCKCKSCTTYKLRKCYVALTHCNFVLIFYVV